MAVAIGHGPQVAQGEDPLQIQLKKRADQENQLGHGGAAAGRSGAVLREDWQAELEEADKENNIANSSGEGKNIKRKQDMGLGDGESGSSGQQHSSLEGVGGKVLKLDGGANVGVGRVGFGGCGQGGRGQAGQLQAGQLQAGQFHAGQLQAGHVEADLVGPAHLERVHHGSAHLGPAHHGQAHHGQAHHGQVHHGQAHLGPAHLGPAHLGPAYLGHGQLGFVSPNNSGMNAEFAFYQQHTVASSSALNSTLVAAGTMLGNIAKGLMEGAGPMLTNLVAMHKVHNSVIEFLNENFISSNLNPVLRWQLVGRHWRSSSCQDPSKTG